MTSVEDDTVHLPAPAPVDGSGEAGKRRGRGRGPERWPEDKRHTRTVTVRFTAAELDLLDERVTEAAANSRGAFLHQLGLNERFEPPRRPVIPPLNSQSNVRLSRAHATLHGIMKGKGPNAALAEEINRTLLAFRNALLTAVWSE